MVSAHLDALRAQLLEVVRSRPGALLHLDEPVQLASGDMSRDFVDAKRAVDLPDNLALAGRAMALAADEAGVRFEAVGGLLVGAAPFAFAVMAAARVPYFLVRKEPKGRGTNRHIEGTELTPGLPVMVVDDVVTRGSSIIRACELVEAAGARVAFATTLVDRGDATRAHFAGTGVAYDAILTYRDLGIEPVGAQPAATH